MSWTGHDYLAAAALLAMAALGVWLVMRQFRGGRRWLGLGGVLGATLLIWAEGAVGVFS